MLAFQGITEAVDGIVTAAGRDFAISESGGQPLRDAIQELKTEVESALRDTAFLEKELPLGTTPNAKVFKPFLATIATDHTQGAVPVLRQLLDDLTRADHAIQQAMARYRDADIGAGAAIAAAGLREE